jgi:hypothetical protein
MVPKCPKDESVSRKLASGMRTAHQVSFLCHFFFYFFVKTSQDFYFGIFWLFVDGDGHQYQLLGFMGHARVNMRG